MKRLKKISKYKEQWSLEISEFDKDTYAINNEVDLICLPSPKICAEVMEGEDGVIRLFSF